MFPHTHWHFQNARLPLTSENSITVNLLNNFPVRSALILTPSIYTNNKSINLLLVYHGTCFMSIFYLIKTWLNVCNYCAGGWEITFECSINFVIYKAFYPYILMISFLISSAYLFTLDFTLGCRGLVGRLYLFTPYALPLAILRITFGSDSHFRVPA